MKVGQIKLLGNVTFEVPDIFGMLILSTWCCRSILIDLTIADNILVVAGFLFITSDNLVLLFFEHFHWAIKLYYYQMR